MCDQHNEVPFGNPDCRRCEEANLDNWENFLKEQPIELPREFSSSSQRLEEKTEEDKKGQKQNLSNYAWITVNPKKDVSLEQLLKAVKKMYSHKWISRYMYIFEIGDNGHNHSHGLIKFDEFPRHKVVTQTKNSVKQICDINNSHCFCIRFVTEDVAYDKVQYMLGLKASNKMDAVQATEKWRADNNIEKYYISGDLSLLSPK